MNPVGVSLESSMATLPPHTDLPPGVKQNRDAEKQSFSLPVLGLFLRYFYGGIIYIWEQAQILIVQLSAILHSYTPVNQHPDRDREHSISPESSLASPSTQNTPKDNCFI